MDLTEYMVSHGHEQLVLCTDKKTGLRAYIGVHSTTLGPSLGGVRLWRYDSSEDAILDVLRLSEGMTYKAAVAGLNLGGGKTVIMADGKEQDPSIRIARFRALGNFIERLNGSYIAAEDVGTKPADMMEIRRKTSYVTGIPLEQGGSGDPSPMTAFGVFCGIQALAEDVLGSSDLSDVRVAIQGLGKVGMGLAEHLLEAGATVIGTDVYEERIALAQAKGIQTVSLDAIYDSDCDIFAPCALGAVLNDDTIPRLRCRIVAGAANNQLAAEQHADMLQARDIVYAVDYVLNAGGLINVAQEANGFYDEGNARRQTARIYHTIKQMLQLARQQNITTAAAAHMMAVDALNNPSPAEEPMLG